MNDQNDPGPIQTPNPKVNPVDTQPGHQAPPPKPYDSGFKDVKPVKTTPLNSFKTILILGGILILLWIIIKIYEAVYLSEFPDLSFWLFSSTA